MITFGAFGQEHYLQMRRAGPRFDMECSGSGLTDVPKLSDAKYAQLQQFGWSAPTLLGELNYSIRWDSETAELSQEDLDDITSVAVNTMRNVYGVEFPAQLSIQKIDWEPDPQGVSDDFSTYDFSTYDQIMTSWTNEETPAPLTSEYTQVSGTVDPSLTAIPLTKWRGLRFMTKADFVPAKCATCHHRYTIERDVANVVADQQGVANRMIRWGTRTEQLGATFTIGASGRRIAAGNESARQASLLRDVLSLASCPSCDSLDVVLYK